jgi:Transposase, Mutator family
MTPAQVVDKLMSSEHAGLIRESVRCLVAELMDAEVAAMVSAEYGERAPERRTAQRNGYRPATAADVQRLSELAGAAYAHYVGRLGGPPRPTTDDYPEVVRRHRVIVGERRGEIVGLVVLGANDEGLLRRQRRRRTFPPGNGSGRGASRTRRERGPRRRIRLDLPLHARADGRERGPVIPDRLRRVRPPHPRRGPHCVSAQAARLRSRGPRGTSAVEEGKGGARLTQPRPFGC